MQPRQQERRFTDSPQAEQPVYRFPQNQPGNGWVPQQGFANEPVAAEAEPEKLSPRERRRANKAHKRKRRRIFTWWNLFAVIGLVTVIVQGVRYIVVPLLVYLKVVLEPVVGDIDAFLSNLFSGGAT